MTIDSTNQMLAKMSGKTNAKIKASSAPLQESLPPNKSLPELTPSPDMENVLSNILGAKAGKKHSPMD